MPIASCVVCRWFGLGLEGHKGRQRIAFLLLQKGRMGKWCRRSCWDALRCRSCQRAWTSAGSVCDNCGWLKWLRSYFLPPPTPLSNVLTCSYAGGGREGEGKERGREGAYKQPQPRSGGSLDLSCVSSVYRAGHRGQGLAYLDERGCDGDGMVHTGREVSLHGGAMEHIGSLRAITCRIRNPSRNRNLSGATMNRTRFCVSRVGTCRVQSVTTRDIIGAVPLASCWSHGEPLLVARPPVPPSRWLACHLNRCLRVREPFQLTPRLMCLLVRSR